MNRRDCFRTLTAAAMALPATAAGDSKGRFRSAICAYSFRDQLKAGLEDWLVWLREPSVDLAPVARAALAHYQFEALHPFSDGNGRTARAVSSRPDAALVRVHAQTE